MTIVPALPLPPPTQEPRVLPGFTAIGIIVLAAVAYSIRIAIDPAAGSHLLTATFLLGNIVGWLLGSTLRRSEPRSVVGLILVLLGDAIFPLNLFAPLILFVPGLRGDVPMTTTAVILIGIAYHLWNYRHRNTARFALPFYSYFFALAGGSGLVLTHYTAALPWTVVAWLLLLFAIGFNEVSYRARPEPRLHFAIASATILTLSAIVSAIAFRDRGEAALAALVAGTIVLVASAIRERADEAIGRSYGLASWIAITITFTALLYYAHSPLWLYIVATGGWTVVLAIVTMLPARGWSEPFQESAWWAAMLLTAALAAALWRVWMPFIIRTLAARPPADATTAGLLETGLAMAALSVWRRRYPQIAGTLRGFVINNLLLRLTSYAAPLLFIVALSGAWLALHAPAPASVYALLMAGTLLLIFGPLLARHYPSEALDFAGILAMVFSAFNGLGSARLSAWVLFAAAAILLVRFIRGAHVWTFGAFLLLAIGGLVLQPIGTVYATVIFLVAAAVIGWASGRAAGMMATVGYWIGHAAGFVFWLSLARTLGLGSGDDAVILATWAWAAFAISRLARGRAARTSRQACLVLIAASLVSLFARPTAAEVMLVSLLTLAALLLELRHLHYGGFVLLGAAVIKATTSGNIAWLVAVLAVTAAVLLWRSLTRGSAFGHLLFVAAAAACAYLTMPQRGMFQALPLALLVALFLLVELLALKVQASSSFHADLTSVVSLLLAVAILAAEVASTRFSLFVVSILLLSVLAVRPWMKSPKGHRLQPAAHMGFRIVGPVAGAVAVVAVARLAGLGAGQQILALACAGWIVLAWLLRTRRGTASSNALAVALHIIFAGVYVASFVARSGNPFLLGACLLAAAGYFAWLAVWKLPLLEHFGAVGVIEAICLWGLARHIAWPEFYLFAAAAYLCIVLLRKTALPVQSPVAVLLIAAAVAYPYFALLRSAQKEHLAFLGIASIAVIHVLLTTGRHLLMIFAVCAMLGVGMLFSATVLHGDVRLDLLMALVGFLVIADLGMIGTRSDRPVVGEIDA